ncbi:hypothetical protein F5Y08DRAFT_307071 [Xylaria arbuscula]|nr:hypothetical protein F5Y08DRAFT_307071 [Xylaria arbuscula]
MMADIKISFAATQLSEQVKESMRFWHRFHDEYSQEVGRIRIYVGMSVLQQIWQQKVVYHRKSKCGDDQFQVQSIKLESCLYQVHEATKVHAGAQTFNYSNDYDTQQHHLTKMRTIGDLVVDLSRKSATNEAACIDLLEELAELAKLADSTRQATSMGHRLDKDTTQNPAKMEERNIDRESNHQDTKVMQEENSCRSWIGEQSAT